MAGGTASPLTVVVVGAGRHGRNLIGLIEDHPGFRIDRVLDDAQAGTLLGYPVDSLARHAGPVWDAVLAIGSGAARRGVVARQGAMRFRWQRFCHPMSHVSRHAEIGAGSTILSFATVGACRLGAHVAVLPSCVIGSGAQLGDFTSLMPQVMIGSDTTIGEGCTVSAGARVLAGLTIGDRCVIGPNAVVDRDMPADSIAAARGGGVRVQPRPRAHWREAS